MKRQLLEVFENAHDAAVKVGTSGARIVRSGSRFGIFIPADVPEEFFKDSLNSMTLSTGRVSNEKGVFVYCKKPSLKEVFADECVKFLEQENVAKISSDPFAWWNNLKALFGNVLSEENHYFVFAELLIYIYLVSECRKANSAVSVVWKSCGSMHDIETSDGAQHEVKSTLSHASSVVTISSKFQMSVAANTPLKLYFVRLEPNRNDGLSINDLVVKAQTLGCDMERISAILEAQGLMSGSPKRKTRFYVSEIKCYDANHENFPRLTPDSFDR